MGIKYIKYKGNVDKREKKLGHYLLFIRTWHCLFVSEMIKVSFRKRKNFFMDGKVVLL